MSTTFKHTGSRSVATTSLPALTEDIVNEVTDEVGSFQINNLVIKRVDSTYKYTLKGELL